MKTIKLTDGRELVFIQPYTSGNITSYSYPKELINLGTITGDYEADFDVKPIISKIPIAFINNKYIGAFNFPLELNITPNEFFKGVMNANDIWMHSPLEKPIEPTDKPQNCACNACRDAWVKLETFKDNLKKWNKAQDKVVSKYIVLIKNQS